MPKTSLKQTAKTFWKNNFREAFSAISSAGDQMKNKQQREMNK